ncbi:MAG TPA: hypothetical protein VK465_18560 [Fibrobacteria bacterium]|nr:hypothetical protein [Fibrobacteria bacterium]
MNKRFILKAISIFAMVCSSSGVFAQTAPILTLNASNCVAGQTYASELNRCVPYTYNQVIDLYSQLKTEGTPITSQYMWTYGFSGGEVLRVPAVYYSVKLSDGSYVQKYTFMDPDWNYTPRTVAFGPAMYAYDDSDYNLRYGMRYAVDETASLYEVDFENFTTTKLGQFICDTALSVPCVVTKTSKLVRSDKEFYFISDVVHTTGNVVAKLDSKYSPSIFRFEDSVGPLDMYFSYAVHVIRKVSNQNISEPAKFKINTLSSYGINVYDREISVPMELGNPFRATISYAGYLWGVFAVFYSDASTVSAYYLDQGTTNGVKTFLSTKTLADEVGLSGGKSYSSLINEKADVFPYIERTDSVGIKTGKLVNVNLSNGQYTIMRTISDHNPLINYNISYSSNSYSNASFFQKSKSLEGVNNLYVVAVDINPISLVQPNATQKTNFVYLTQTPILAFTSTHAGSLIYDGCSSTKQYAVVGKNDVKLDKLVQGYYKSCRVFIKTESLLQKSLTFVPFYVLNPNASLQLARAVTYSKGNTVLVKNTGLVNAPFGITLNGKQVIGKVLAPNEVVSFKIPQQATASTVKVYSNVSTIFMTQRNIADVQGDYVIENGDQIE